MILELYLGSNEINFKILLVFYDFFDSFIFEHKHISCVLCKKNKLYCLNSSY